MAFFRSLFGEEAAIVHDRDFQVLMLANITPAMGAGLLSPILDSLIDPFGATPASIGLLMSALTAPAIVMIPLAGLVADRYGRKPVLIASLLLFGTAGIGLALTTDFQVALVLRGLQGIAFGGIAPVIITSLGDIYDEATEATAQGIRFAGSGTSLTVFPLLAGALVVIAWQLPVLLYGVAIPLAAIVYRWFDEPMTASRSDSVAANGNGRSQLAALVDLVTRRHVLAMVIARGFPEGIWIGVLTYNSIVVVRILGGTPTLAGLLVALGSLTYAIAASQAGRITARFESRLHPLLVANLCLGIGFGAFVSAPSISFALVGVVIAGVGFGLSLALYRSIITGLAGASMRAGLVGLAEGTGRVNATLTPIVMGWIIAVGSPQFGFAPAVQLAGVVIAGVGAIGGIVCLLVAKSNGPI